MKKRTYNRIWENCYNYGYCRWGNYYYAIQHARSNREYAALYRLHRKNVDFTKEYSNPPESRMWIDENGNQCDGWEEVIPE